MRRRRDEEEKGLSTHAAGTFEIESWDEQPYDEYDGTRLTKSFSGDVEGESAAELLMVYGSEEGSAAYVGLERVTDSVHGRSGTFVLRHSAAMERGEGKFSLDMVPDSGTGELRGLRGEARISVESGGGDSFTLDYDFE